MPAHTEKIKATRTCRVVGLRMERRAKWAKADTQPAGDVQFRVPNFSVGQPMGSIHPTPSDWNASSGAPPAELHNQEYRVCPKVTIRHFLLSFLNDVIVEEIAKRRDVLN